MQDVSITYYLLDISRKAVRPRGARQTQGNAHQEDFFHTVIIHYYSSLTERSLAEGLCAEPASAPCKPRPLGGAGSRRFTLSPLPFPLTWRKKSISMHPVTQRNQERYNPYAKANPPNLPALKSVSN